MVRNDLFSKMTKGDALTRRRDANLEAIRKPFNGITCTTSQVEALEQMIEWSYGPETAYTLKGYAGTGKTTILEIFLRNNRHNFQIAVTAPTHKAKYIAEEKTGRSGFTIQKLLGLRPNLLLEDYNPNKPEFTQQSVPQIKKFKLLVVDEVSMLNDDLFDLIIAEAEKYGVKVLFVGDPCQMPQIVKRKWGQSGVKTSKAFSGVIGSSELTEVIRQKDTSPLLEKLTLLRYDIINDTNDFEESLTLVPESINDETGEGYRIIGDVHEYAGKVTNSFTGSDFQADMQSYRCITWSNPKVKLANRFIRGKLNRGKSLVSKGDLLMSYCNLSLEYSDNLVSNSEDFKVMEVKQGKNGYGNWGWKIALKSLYSKKLIEDLFICHPEGYSKVAYEYQNALNYAKSDPTNPEGWALFNSYKRHNLLMEDIVDVGGRILRKKDFDYGYALTIHKTQGSTYTDVFVNGNNINDNPNLIEKKHLWYVALSRPTRFVNILF